MAALTVTVAATTSLVVRKIYAQRGPQAYTATKVEKFLTAPGVYGVQEESIVAVRSDGSIVEVRRRTAPDGRVVEQKRVSDAPSRKRTVVDGLTDSVTTYRISDTELPRMVTRTEQCATSQPGAARVSMLGHEVVRDEREYKHNASTKRVDAWRAPALNCLALKETFTLTQADGSQFVTNLREVTSVVLGEPDASLFSIPVHYKERSPSEVFQQHDTRYSAQGSNATDPSGFTPRKLDEIYQHARP